MILGSLLPLSMAPFNYWILGIISVGGFSFLILKNSAEELSFKLIFFRSFSYAVGLYAVGVSWIFVSIHRYGQASIELSTILVVLFIIFLSILFALPFTVISKLNHLQVPSKSIYKIYCSAFFFLFIFPSLWVIGEWFRGWVFSGFPWLFIGYPHSDTWLSGWAPVTGVLGISWIIAFCGTLLGFFLQLKTNIIIKDRPARFIFIITTGSFLLATFFWVGGLYLQKINWTKPLNKTISIGLLQPAISLWRTWDPKELNNILFQFRQDSKLLLDNDLVVWPEAAIPIFRNKVSDYLDSITEDAVKSDTAIIVGVPTIYQTQPQSDEIDESNYFNSALALGKGLGIYHKQHLVPFGEYVPFEKWLRGGIRFFDLPMSAFSPGPNNQINITIKNNITIGTSICYEVAFSELVRKSANDSNILLTMSNDSWFGKTIGPKQHFQIARMRAIENKKALIRATNDGISALIDSNGRVQFTIPSFNRGILEGTLNARSGSTPFGRSGSYPIIIFSLVWILIGLCLKPAIKVSH